MSIFEPSNSIPLPSSSRRALLVYTLGAMVSVPLLLSIGTERETISRTISVLFILLNSAWIPGVYLIGALGLGRCVRPILEQMSARGGTKWLVEWCVGLSITLWLTHLLGILGVLNPVWAWAVTGLGCVLVFHDRRLHHAAIMKSLVKLRFSIAGMVFVVGCVLTVLMSCLPPGVSWDSEYGGYDSLSYHLQLPRLWLEEGRIWPTQSNAYSFLPSSFESAYLHFAHLAATPPTLHNGLSGMLGNDGRIVMSTHLFSAMLLILSGLGIGALSRRMIEQHFPSSNDQDTRWANRSAMLASALLVCTPWLALVGSLAYNEIGVVFLGIGAFAVAGERSVSPTARSCLAAILVGGACCCKPTAIFLLAPSVAVLLLWSIPAKQWLKPVSIGLVFGLLTLLPWLIRNELATGNPVFPQLGSLFGQGHWTPAQHSVYHSAHHFEGSLFDRLRLLVMPDPNGTDITSMYRGLSNPQWAFVPWFGFAGGLALCFRASTRGVGLALLLAIVLPILGWMGLTHLQSRFFVPLAPILILAGAMGLSQIPFRQTFQHATLIVAPVALVWTILIVSTQFLSNPFTLLIMGTKIYTGEIDFEPKPWSSSLNTILAPDETVYLLGDAAALYVRSPMIANTVYDRWLIEDAIEQYPDSPAQWTSVLLENGADVVVISSFEIHRFEASGWLSESIDTEKLREWITTLGEPIYTWNLPDQHEPIRAAYRLRNP